ncbi:MAG: sigma-70 family RNA polymerase sigma factor [Flavobacteriales bacterium]|nr:sigma-70 family RNA polymerase sigma factor [Flavobacteriales bacterium]MCB9449011.1 sigma-70 family RNA polymerase sigma factor [Flavobacteriales bacterium]
MNNNPQYHFTKDQLRKEVADIHAARKNPAKFEVLYKRYYEQIMRFIYQRVDSRDVASDLTSQVFLKAMINLKKYTDKGVPFASWLYRIALNEVRLHFRDDKAAHVVNARTEHLVGMISEMEEEADDNQVEQLVSAIDKLDDADVEILELRYFEQRSFKEVGEILEVTENNAKVRTYRVLDRLREVMQVQIHTK